MAGENPNPNQNPLDNLKKDPKQLAKVGVLVVVVLFIGYEVMGLFGSSGGSSKPAQAPAANTAKMSAAAPASPAAAPMTNTAAMPPAAPQTASSESASGTGTAKSDMGSTNAELMKLQKETEEKYLTAVNELQMLKVQQAIAETNQAIATAKLATVTSEKNITEVLTKPSAASAEASYANNLVNPVQSGQALANMPAPPTPKVSAAPPVEIIMPDAQFVVLSVTQQGGKWSAVMGLGNKLFTANVGDTLSDTSVVKSINKEGVILEKNKKTRAIQMSNLI